MLKTIWRVVQAVDELKKFELSTVFFHFDEIERRRLSINSIAFFWNMIQCLTILRINK